MTSFHAAFGSLNQEQTRSNENGINFNHRNQESIDFSTVDLDQQVAPSFENHSSLYVSLNDTAPFQTDSLSTAGAMSNTPSYFSSST